MNLTLSERPSVHDADDEVWRLLAIQRPSFPAVCWL